MGTNLQLEAGVGAIVGACVGDAAGATLEFLGRKPSRDEVESAMEMVGGGVFQLARGQITDDGELTLCLARGLADAAEFDLELIARNYADWFASTPFDIGFATRSAFGAAAPFRSDSQSCIHEIMTVAAIERNAGSKANGSLMRAVPLAVWGHRLEPAEIARLAHLDSRLSHPSQSCCDAVAAYCIAISALINRPQDRLDAWKRTAEWAEDEACDEVKSWLRLAEAGERPPCYPQAGFVKIAFTHAFSQLLAGSPFADAVRETLEEGGDTDTNACIVGGMIGAADGVGGIPDHQLRAVIRCDTSEGRHPRPDSLRTTNLTSLAKKLIDVGSTDGH